MLWMEPVIYVALEIGRPMKPRAYANEGVPAEPFWTVIASGSTVIRGDVIVAIRAFGRANGNRTRIVLSDVVRSSRN
jgi:hypothetical protein